MIIVVNVMYILPQFLKKEFLEQSNVQALSGLYLPWTFKCMRT